MAFPHLSPAALETLAAALHASRLSRPWTAQRLEPYLARQEREEAAQGLEALFDLGMTPHQMAYTLKLLAEERRKAQVERDRVELVWSGLEGMGTSARSTSVVVRDLFRRAERSVVVASYGLDLGKSDHNDVRVFKPLAECWSMRPELQVRLYVDIKRPMDNHESAESLRAAFQHYFWKNVWPWQPTPEVYFDERSLAPWGGNRASMHAKAVVIDDREVFITSANFTRAAQERNYEVGVLLANTQKAQELRLHFEGLVQSGKLTRL